jgi:hypothetical protein
MTEIHLRITAPVIRLRMSPALPLGGDIDEVLAKTAAGDYKAAWVKTLKTLTGAATLAAGALLYGAGTSQMATLAAGAAGAILQANGAAAPSWTTAPTLTGLTISGAVGSVRVFSQVLRGSTTAWLLAVRDATDDLRFRAYDDAGAAIDYPLTIARAAGGLVSIPRPVAVGVSALLGSEIARFGGGSTPGTPGATDVLVGNGYVVCGAGFSTLGNCWVQNAVSAALTLAVMNTSSGSSAYARVYVQNDGASPRAHIDAYSSGYTGAAWGIVLANWLAITGSSSASNGIIYGHTSNKPVVFGVGSIEAARFTGGTIGADSFAVKYTTASTSTTTGAHTVAGGLGVVGRINAGSYITTTTADAGTTNAATGLVLGHTTSGTPDVGFGTQVVMDAQSTTTAGRSQALITAAWSDATDATRKARISLYAYDTSARLILRGEASGTASMIGFLGANPVVRQTVPGAATDAATTQTLANSLRTALINLGLAA